MLEQAVVLEDGLRYDEPEPLNFSVRQWLGALLLELNRRAMRSASIARSWTITRTTAGASTGSSRHFRAQNKTAEAERIHQEFVTAWSRSDTLLRSLALLGDSLLSRIAASS